MTPVRIRTRGLSPKLLAPIIAALSAVLVTWTVTGDLNREELGILVAAAVGAAGAYLAPPGEVEIPDLEALPYDVDELLALEQEDTADGPPSP